MLIPPLVIVDDGQSIEIYRTTIDAESCLEAIDVAGGVVRGFDSAGRLLQLTSGPSGVQITAKEESPTHEKELRSILVGYLGQVGRRPNDEGSVLGMIEQCPELFIVSHESLITMVKRSLRRLFGLSRR